MERCLPGSDGLVRFLQTSEVSLHLNASISFHVHSGQLCASESMCSRAAHISQPRDIHEIRKPSV